MCLRARQKPLIELGSLYELILENAAFFRSINMGGKILSGCKFSQSLGSRFWLSTDLDPDPDSGNLELKHWFRDSTPSFCIVSPQDDIFWRLTVFLLLSGIIWNKSQSTQNQKPEQLLASRGEHNTPNTHSTPFSTITMPTHVTSHTKTSYIFIYFSPTHIKEINYTTTNHKQIFSSHAKFHFFFPKSWRVATQFSSICAQKCNQPLIVLLLSFKN
jgi:hypothetical protein